MDMLILIWLLLHIHPPEYSSLRMEHRLREDVEFALAEMRPSAAGVSRELPEVNHGVVTMQYQQALETPVFARGGRTRATEEIAIEVAESQHKKWVPGFSKVTLIVEE